MLVPEDKNTTTVNCTHYKDMRTSSPSGALNLPNFLKKKGGGTNGADRSPGSSPTKLQHVALHQSPLKSNDTPKTYGAFETSMVRYVMSNEDLRQLFSSFAVNEFNYESVCAYGK